MLQFAKRWPSLSHDPAVIIAQYDELKRQIPLLYALLISNALAITYSHFRYASDWLTLCAVGTIIFFCAWRLLAWTLFAEPAATISPGRARALLRRTTLAVVPIAAAFFSYTLALDQYGGPSEHAAIAVCMAITVIGCIFCLIHLPQAAMLVHVTVMAPFLIYHFYRGDPVFTAMALNVVAVTSLMLRVLLNSFAGFNRLISSQTNLAAKEADTQRLSEENARLALTDVLTELPNRRFFFAHFETVLAACATSGERFAVGLLDLDRFKPINDAYGHAIGDRLLVAIAARLALLSGAEIVVARLGGDEFGLLVTSDIDRVVSIGQDMCDLLSRPFEIDDQRMSLGCSIGIAVFPAAGTTANELIDRADYALYSVKSTRPGNCALFSADHETNFRSERALETTLQTADLDKELHVEFQPIVCIKTLAVLNVEALGRWTSPIIGTVQPDQFITTAERIGLMNSVTAKLFRIALASLSSIPPTIGLSFNLSAHDIVSPDTIRMLVRAIGDAGVDAKRITFELTETALMRDFDAAVAGITVLRDLGITIALDDFGMGYSSLSYLNRLPLDKVKVDRSFVADMDEDSGRKIIAAILGLCVTLELDCIIEGVETERQLQQLRNLGYCIAQGYLFAPPMPLPALLTWLADAKALPSRRRQPPPARRPSPRYSRDGRNLLSESIAGISW